mgnify:FL=1
MKVDKIFVTHHKPLKERKEYLTQALKSNDIEVEWVEAFSDEEIKDNYEEYISRREECFKGTIITQQFPGKKSHDYENFSKEISLSELSLYLKHRYCFEQQLKHSYDTILILEDDIMVPNDFKTYINNHMDEFIESDGDMLVMGKSHWFDVLPHWRTGEWIHTSPNFKTRCTHAIVYSKKCINKILDNIDIINLPIDFKLNEIIQKENLKVYWSQPGIMQNKSFQGGIAH